MPATCLEPAPPAASVRVEDHLGLAWKVARRFAARALAIGLDVEDLAGALTLKLVEIAPRYEPSRCPSFAAFAWLPLHRQARRCLNQHRVLRQVPEVADGHPDLLGEIPARAEPDPRALTEAKGLLGRLLPCLPPAERDLLSKRFGLDGHQEHRLKDLGRELGCSRERAGQRVEMALAHLRQEADRLGLLDDGAG